MKIQNKNPKSENPKSENPKSENLKNKRMGPKRMGDFEKLQSVVDNYLLKKKKLRRIEKEKRAAKEQQRKEERDLNIYLSYFVDHPKEYEEQKSNLPKTIQAYVEWRQRWFRDR